MSTRSRTAAAAEALLAAGAAGAAVAAVLGLVVAPPDAVQGDAQRWMYLHVPAAWCAYLCYAVVLVGSVRVLRVRGRLGTTSRADVLARAAATVGVVLTAVTLASGSVWGALTWGTGWVWDARVTSTTVLGLVYVAYLAAHGLARGPRARTAVAGLGVAGFAVVPVVHMSVVWWRTLHQPPTLLGPGTGTPIDPTMALALCTAVVAATALAVGAVLALTSRATGAPAGVVAPARVAGAPGEVAPEEVRR